MVGPGRGWWYREGVKKIFKEKAVLTGFATQRSGK